MTKPIAFIQWSLDGQVRDWDSGLPLDRSKFTGLCRAYFVDGSSGDFYYRAGVSGGCVAFDRDPAEEPHDLGEVR